MNDEWYKLRWVPKLFLIIIVWSVMMSYWLENGSTGDKNKNIFKNIINKFWYHDHDILLGEFHLFGILEV
jgi:hypothetical protein